MRQVFRAAVVMTLLLAVMMPAPGAAQKDAGAEAAVQDARLPGVNIAIRRDALDNNTPAVAYNSTRNEYLVVWTTINGETWDLTARRVGADGQLRDSYIVTSTAHIRSYQPAAVWNPASGEYLVAFASDPRDNGDFNIYASRFTPDLVQIGTPTLVSTNTGGVDWDPAVVWNPVFNQYMVVWQNYFTETNAYIRAARLKANGELIENIALAGGAEGHPCAAPDVAYTLTACIIW